MSKLKIEELPCPECETPFPSKRNRIRRKYCSNLCANRFNARLRFSPASIRFFNYALIGDKQNCWLWLGATNGVGYGKIKHEQLGLIGAHRLSWMIHKGPIPDGLFVCHKCDNPPCVNPDHLFIGTHQDNMDDMLTKGRRVFPPRKPKVKSNRQTSSRFRGVSWAGRNGWRVRVAPMKNITHIGYYKSELNAALAYDHVATELYGERATLNFPTANHSNDMHWQ